MNTAEEERISPAMRHVLDLLLEGQNVPAEAMDALTEPEREDLGALARTANLTRLVLQQPEPPEGRAEASLARAEEALLRFGARAPVGADEGEAPSSGGPSILDRLRRLLRVRTEDED